MRKLAKRLGALLLATLMLLGATLSAGAVEANDELTGINYNFGTAAVKVNGVDSGDTINAYRLMWYNEDGNYNSYSVYEDFAKYLETKGATSTAPKDIAEFLTNKSSSDMNTYLEEYVSNVSANKEGYTLPDATATATATSSNVTVNLEPGYYLLLMSTTSKNGRVYKPMSVFVSVDGTSKIVYGGNSTSALKPDTDGSYAFQAKASDGPSIDKKTKGATGDTWKATGTAAVGDKVPFCVQVNIPAYTDIKNMLLTVKDTLTNMKYVEGSAKVYDGTPTEANVIENAVKATNVGDYTTAKDEDAATETGTQNVDFELNYNAIVGENKGVAKVVYLYYEAVVQKEAVRAGTNYGTNTAKLEYANAATPGSKMETDPSTTTVYNYNFSLKKYKGDTQESLKGAKFSFYRTAEDAQNDKNAIEFIEDQNHSKYYRLADRSDADNNANKVTKLEANFEIRGLDAGTYYMREVETPAGYYAPNSYFTITLKSKLNENNKDTGKLDGDLTQIEANDTNDATLIIGKKGSITGDGEKTLEVGLKNSTNPSLPTTGGMGTMLFTIGGIALMALAAYMFFFRKRGEAK